MTHRRARGTTLVEVILVIALVGVLALQLLPALAEIRNRARTTASLSNLRQHAAVLAAYSTDFNGQLPFITDPVASWSVIRCESAGVAIEVPFFAATRYWNVGLADGYYSGAWNAASFFSPWSERLGAQTTYELSCALVADPKYFEMESRADLPRQLRPVRIDEAIHPAKKSALVSAHSVNLDLPSRDYEYWAIGRRGGDASFLDGHAASVRAEDAEGEVFVNGDGPASLPAYGGHVAVFLPMSHTLNGIRGRDLR